MKKLFLAIALMAIAAVTASAQFMNNSGSSKSGRSSASTSTSTGAFDNAPSHFGSIWFTYSPITFKVESPYTTATSSKIHGFSIGYTNANKLAPIPIYIEYGIGARYGFNKENQEGIDVTTHLVSVSAPLRLLFRFGIPGTSISLVPFTGFDFIVHALGKEKYSGGGYSATSDLFNKDDMYGAQLNRFNMDWHIGARVMFGNFFLAASYELPLVRLYDKDSVKMGLSMANISLGVAF